MRAAVTTAADSFDRVAEAFAAHRIEAVPLPCIAIEAADDDELDTIRALASTADRILVTSARAVRVVWPGSVPAVPFLSVGPATSDAVARAGGTVLAEGSGGAADLLDRIDVAGLRVVFPHAAGADPETEAALRARGASVDARVAYRSVPIGPESEPVDAVTFASPSAVEGWCLTRSLEDQLIAAIGPTTAAAVEGRGGTVDLIAERPGFEEMAAALHHGPSIGETR